MLSLFFNDPTSERTCVNIHNFSEMNISPPILRALEKMGYTEPTTVQYEAIPHLMEWKDIIAKAPTGTGKTFAFGIPILEHIDAADNRIQALILGPTRELVMQTCVEMRGLSHFLPIVKTVAIYGGQPIPQQITALKKHPQIVAATPGRLIDLVMRGLIDLSGVQTFVLDEADRMLDMGFMQDVTRIIDMVPDRKNLALLSATISREVMDIAWVYQREAVEITVPADVVNKPNIKQYSIDMTGIHKTEALTRILNGSEFDRLLIFCNTKSMVKRLTQTLANLKFSVDCLHGDMRQSLREKVMKDFRNGNIRILIATDVASRGLDVDDVDAVINYDLPDENEYYIHRIGRTGRAKKSGIAFTFVSYTDAIRLKEIIRYTKSEVEPLRFDSKWELVPANAGTKA